MVLSETEREGCRVILGKLLEEDLKSLARTVTKNQVSVDSKADAVDVILTYSESAADLLGRQKIRKEILVQYLVEKKVPFSVTFDKRKIIANILEIWRLTSHAAPEDTETEEKSLEAIAETKSVSDPKQIRKISSGGDTEKTSIQFEKNDQQTEIVSCQYNMIYVSSSQTIQNTECKPEYELEPNREELQKLGEMFSVWFYRMLNSNNSYLHLDPEDFGPQHFWNDAKLQMIYVNKTQEVFGASEISQTLLALVKEQQLIFNPNTKLGGTKTKGEPHGLITVNVCGTVHRQDMYLGLFEQQFELIKNPSFENNWKIKSTKLRLWSA